MTWTPALALSAAVAPTVYIECRTNAPHAEIERWLSAFEDRNAMREQKLREFFEPAGCTGQQLQAPNSICAFTGELHCETVVGAQFDSVDRGQDKGVVDNWKGWSLIAESVLRPTRVQRRHRSVFVGFTAEELVGPQFCVYQMGKEGAMKVSALLTESGFARHIRDQAGIGPR